METSRLLIRTMKESDENAFVNGIADRNLRVLYGFPADMDESVPPQIFYRFCKLPRAYSIVEKKTDNMIGFLLDVDPELPEDISNSLPKKGRTLAFATFRPYQRQGYMEETLKAYIPYQLQNNGTEYIHCGHFMDNNPSRCLLQKLGFHVYSKHEFKDRIIIDQIIRQGKMIIFESERISFLEVSEHLINDYLDMVNDYDNVNRFIGSMNKTFTEEMEIKWVQEKLAEKAPVFSMVDKNSGRFIGNIELMDVTNTEGELGIALTAKMQNQGYGTEAISSMVEYCFHHFGLKRIFLRTRSYNARAFHVYEKCGFREYDRTEDHIFMEIIQ